MKKLDIILLVIGGFLAAFIICMIVIFCIYQATPDALIAGVLGGSGLEALICGAIKVINTIHDNKQNDEEVG